MKLRDFTGIFTHDLKNKGIALFFAVTIWYFAWNNQITVSETGEMTLYVRIDSTRADAEEWQIVRLWSAREHEADVDQRETVKVKLSVTGPQQDVNSFVWSNWDKVLLVRPEDCYRNEGYLMGQERLTERLLVPPVRSLRVVEDTITPSVLHFQLSRVVTKKLPVGLPTINGRPPPPLRLSTTREPEIEPAALNVRGAEYYLQSCRIVIEEMTLEDVGAQDLSYTAEVVARLEYPKDALNSAVFVDERGQPLAGTTRTVRVTVFFEPEPTDMRQLEVNLWAKVPLAAQGDRPIAVRCDRSRVTVKFVGTTQDIETVLANKDKPEFGLYFVVDPTKKPGEPWPLSLTDFKWDQRLIPAGVRLQEADATPGSAKGTGTVIYTLIPVPAKED